MGQRIGEYRHIGAHPVTADRTVVYVVEMECIMCSRKVGEARLDNERDPLHPYWLTMRCSHCGGSVIKGETTRQYDETRVSIEDLAAHRGRPSNAMLERRRQLMESL